MRLAYVDHRLKFTPKSFLQALQKAGVEFKPYESIEEFSKENNLKNFSVFLCHPGLNNQPMLSKIAGENPHLNIGLVSFTEWEYCESDIPSFSYNLPESVIEWIRKNQ